ncbi:hypothetical protein HK405_009863 [Cladochytrium tenue]|nr:hypothetical protein HK405_009863 [Cladochytrium tenue]
MSRSPYAPAEKAPVRDFSAPLCPATGSTSISAGGDDRDGANEPQAASFKPQLEVKFCFCVSPSIDSDDHDEFSRKQYPQAGPATEPSPGGFAQSLINEARALAALTAAVVLRLVGSRWRMVKEKLQRDDSADSTFDTGSGGDSINYGCVASFSDGTATSMVRQEFTGDWVSTPATPDSVGPVSIRSSFGGGGGGAIANLIRPPSGCDARAYAAHLSHASTLPSRMLTSESVATAPWGTPSAEPGSKLAVPLAPALATTDGGLPGGYATYYTPRLGRLVTLALLKTPTPPQVVPVALLLVRRLVAQTALPRSLATPTRLLLAALALADTSLSDMPVPARVWDEVAGACGIIKEYDAYAGGGGGVNAGLAAELKRDALALLGFEVHVSPEDFQAWQVALERIAAAVADAPRPPLPLARRDAGARPWASFGFGSLQAAPPSAIAQGRHRRRVATSSPRART